MRRQCTDSENMQNYVDGLKASMYVEMPGAVIAYQPATMTATVQPMVQDPRNNLDTGGFIYEPWPEMVSIPVRWPRFGGGAGLPSIVIAGTLNPGDQVLMKSFDLDPSTWLQQGRSLSPVIPAHVNRLNGAHWTIDPVDICSAPVGRSTTAPEPGTLCLFLIGPEGSQQQLQFRKDGTISLGATGVDFVVLASLMAGELAKIAASISAGVTVSTGLPNTKYVPGNIASALIHAQ